MSVRNPKLSPIQIFLLVLPLYIIFPIIFYFGEEAISFVVLLFIVTLLVYLFLRLHTNISVSPKFLFFDRAWYHFFSNTPLKRQIFVFTMGTLGLILWLFILFWSEYQFQGKQVFIREKCKQLAQETERALDPSGKINYNIYNANYKSCLQTEKVSFIEYMQDFISSYQR